MNRATKARTAQLARVTMMVRDGVLYRHDPATVGHAKHTASCWFVEADTRSGMREERAP